MSFQTERKVGNSIYVYEITGYRDKKTGKVKQHRKYIGVKNAETGIVSNPRKEKWSHSMTETNGVIHAVEKCLSGNHLRDILAEAFGQETGSKIFALSTYCATEGTPMYLYESWAHGNENLSSMAMSSQDISDFLNTLGFDEKSRSAFWTKWAQRHGKNRNLVFDITSISTYSSGLELSEWGHNRDGESLPQINLGMVYSDRPGTPLGYKVYPGSIGDVSTMKNLLHYLKHDLLLTHSRMVMDRGFFSNANIRNLDSAGFDYLIPVPAGTRLAKDLLLSTEECFKLEGEYINFNGRLLAHAEVCREYAGGYRKFQVFLDFERRRMETQTMLNKLDMIAERFNPKDYRSIDEVKQFINSVASGYFKLFTVRKNEKSFTLQRNQTAIHEYARKFGKIILLPINFNTEPLPVLNDYFRRDGVEKFFDTLKNEMDSGRGRVQSQETFDGRLFVHMIGLIIYGEMMNRMKKNAETLKFKMAFPEMISHLKRLKRIHSADGTTVLSELTKKQKSIFKVLEIDLPE